jgi:hypothetical protein
VVFTAVIFAAFVQYRLHGLRLLVTNADGKFPRHADFKSSEVKFADRIRNCEDAVLVEGKEILIMAPDPGRDLWNNVMVRRCVSPTASYVFLTSDRASLTQYHCPMPSSTYTSTETLPCRRSSLSYIFK